MAEKSLVNDEAEMLGAGLAVVEVAELAALELDELDFEELLHAAIPPTISKVAHRAPTRRMDVMAVIPS
jgi:hypothetical protein